MVQKIQRRGWKWIKTDQIGVEKEALKKSVKNRLRKLGEIQIDTNLKFDFQ